MSNANFGWTGDLENCSLVLLITVIVSGTFDYIKVIVPPFFVRQFAKDKTVPRS